MRKKINDFTNNIPGGILYATGIVAINMLINKETRGDTFINTAKKSAVFQAKNAKEHLSVLFKDFLKLKKIGNGINKIGNKTMFALTFLDDVLLGTILCSALFGFKKENK